jgi:hypothetical protein
MKVTMSETKRETSNDSTMREEYPTGWLTLVKNKSAAKIIDALLDLPPYREFNQTELADLAEVSRQSVGRHKDLLLKVNVIEEVDDTGRYRFNPESEVSESIIALDGAMNKAGPGHS